MKNQPLVVPVTPTRRSQDKLADHKPHSIGTSLVTLLYLSLLLSSIDSMRAAPKPSGPPPASSQSCGVFALARLGELLHIAPEAREQILNSPPPEGGFSVADLQTLAAKYDMIPSGVGGCLKLSAMAGRAESAAASAAKTAPRITEKGIARVEQHLGRPELDALSDPGNAAMLQRLRAGSKTPQDINFYMHELKESALMNKGLDACKAHLDTLEWQGIHYAPGYEAQLYHPTVIRNFPEYFNRAAHPKP